MIISGVPWFDDQGRVVNAKAGCLLQVGEVYYLYGEFKTDSENHFNGFSCYHSTDLTTWIYDGLALVPQSSGLLSSTTVGERVKVIQVADRFVMYMHCDDLTYTSPVIGVAIADQPDRPVFDDRSVVSGRGTFRYWDMGTFTDEDGSHYLLTHGGNCFALAADGLSVERAVVLDIAPEGESPAMFKADGTYYWLQSNKTSWDRNDNFYYYAKTLAGPWQYGGLMAPAGSNTYDSQCSFVFRLPNGEQMYMGDRWSFPHQASCATQVWLPIVVDGPKQFHLENCAAWEPETMKAVRICGESCQFSAVSPAYSLQAFGIHQQVRVIGLHGPEYGYGQATLLENGRTIQTVKFDAYAPNHYEAPLIAFDQLLAGNYVIQIQPLGEHGTWTDKTKRQYGSTGNRVEVTQIDSQ